MKIRTGFVSNSSSSSFCLVGMSFHWASYKDLVEHLKTLNIKQEDIPNYITSLNFSSDIKVYFCDEDVTIGRDIFSLKDDETLGEVKTHVAKNIEEHLKMKCSKDDISIVEGDYYY